MSKVRVIDTPQAVAVLLLIHGTTVFVLKRKCPDIDEQIQRMVKLQKLKAKLTPANGEANVGNEAWAEAAGETVEDLKRILEEGETAKEDLGECVFVCGWVCVCSTWGFSSHLS